MTRARNLLTTSVLQRVRVAAMVFACLAPLSQLPVGVDPTLPAIVQALGRVPLLLLIVVFVATLLVRRTIPFEPLIVGGLIVAAGVALADPMVVIGLGMGTLVHQSLYGSRRTALLRTATVCGAFLLTITLSAAAAQRGLTWHSSVVLGNLPGIIGAGAVMRVLFTALTSHQQTAERDAVLARTAAALLGETDVDTVRRIGGAAGAELCALQPGVGALRLRVEPDRVVVENSTGVFAAARGAVLPAGCVVRTEAADGSAGSVVADPAPLDRLAGRSMHWHAMPLTASDGMRHLVIGAGKPLAGEVLAVHRVLAA